MLKKVPVFVFIVGLTLVLLLSGFANGDLPPRPTPMPTAVPTETAVSPVTGGFIQLQVTTAADKAGLWTVVQWQDGNKDWHTVEGWQGTFNPDGMVTWWVAPADLGKGPFRWQLLDAEGGTSLAVSEAFTLPASDGQVLAVTVGE
jgi:hypothetical protein